MLSKNLIRRLYKKYPTSIAKKYHDYYGLMCGKLKEETKTIVTCLDVSKEVVKVAKENKADLIISHHPFIYGKKAEVLLDPYKKDLYDDLEKNNIPVYSFHTNFDEGPGGINDSLAQELDLKDIKPLKYEPMGRCGTLPLAMNLKELTKYAIKKLGIKYAYFIGDKDKVVSKIAIVGGAGASMYKNVFKEGDIDCYLSGDTPYHIRKELAEKGLCYINVDHEVEKVFIKAMKKQLLLIDNTLNIIECNDVKQAKLVTK